MANKKTYGVRGVLEWVAQIKAGKATISVHFSGGYPTTNGHTPAEFTTDNAVIQAAIERSDYYRRGRIKLIKEYKSAPPPAQSVERAEAAANSIEAGGSPAASASERETVTVEVSSLADAASYLKANYGISAQKVKTMEAANAVGESLGVKFVQAE